MSGRSSLGPHVATRYFEVVRRWELWRSIDDEGVTTTEFFPATSEKSRVMARAEGAVKVWETVASSTNEAMRLRNEHLGFAPYQPMLRDDGTPYPEDEDDELLRLADPDTFDKPWPGVCVVAGKVIQVPGSPDPDEVLRTGRLEFVCPACGQNHVWRFGPGARSDP